MNKRILTLLLAFLTTAALCFFAGCGKKPPVEVTNKETGDTSSEPSGSAYHEILQNQKTHTVSTFPSMTRAISDGQYYMIENGALRKYDLRLGEVLPACTDPGCPHAAADCISNLLPGNAPGENAGSLLFVCGGVIYTRRGNTIYAYDEKTSKAAVFFDASEKGVLLTACPYKDALLLQIRVITTDENGRTSGETTLFCVGSGGKKAKELLKFEQNDTELLFADGERAYFVENNRLLYAVNLESGAREDLVKRDFIWRVALSRGKILYSYISKRTELGFFDSCAIRVFDPSSGEDRLICDEAIVQYDVTDDDIYYIPRAADRAPYALWRIDHDGRNKEKILTFENIPHDRFGFEFFLIEGDYLLASDGTDYCYDLTDGSFTMIGSKDRYR